MSNNPRGWKGPGVDSGGVKPQVWWGPGTGRHTNPGMGFGAFLVLVFLFIVAPISFAIAGVSGIKYGQQKLLEVGMSELRLKMGEDEPWPHIYNFLVWFRELKIGAGESFLIGLSIFFVVFLVVALLRAIVANERRSRARITTAPDYSVAGYGYSSGGYGSFSSSRSSATQPESNPLFRASKIESTLPPSTKLLRDSSGLHIGSIEKDPLAGLGGRDQLIRDASGHLKATIERRPLFQDRQEIKDTSGHKIGEIKDGPWGGRVIVDRDGREVGKFKDGRIELSSSYKGAYKEADDRDSNSESAQTNDYGTCYLCGEALDESGYCPNWCEEDEEE